jgi:hypothetical protein
MTAAPLMECEVTFLTEQEGGRRSMPILSGGKYWPHVVVGDPSQRKVILTERMMPVEYADGTKGEEWTDKYIDEEYLGVRFESGPANGKLGEPLIVTLLVPFWSDDPIYKKLSPSATFTLREGGTIVGHRKMLRWLPVS